MAATTTEETSEQKVLPLWRVLLGFVGVAVLGLVIPGGGLALALVFFFTAFKTRVAAKWLALGLGALLLVGWLFAFGTMTENEIHVSDPVVVENCPACGS